MPQCYILRVLDYRDSQNRLEFIIIASVILLVAITPLGNEGTQPLVLAIYRTLLFVIAVGCAIGAKKQQQVSGYFLIGAGATMTAMLASVVLRPGSHFEGLYVFYKNLLFLAAFVSFAQWSRSRSWKNTVLASVVIIDLVYVTVTFALGARPLTATFANPNYFASFLLVGFAVLVAITFRADSLRLKITASIIGLILYYGINQTSSRGVTLAAFAVLIAACLRTLRHGRAWRIGAAAVFTAIVIITVVGGTRLREKFMDRGQRDPYNYQRTSIWMGSLKMTAGSPLLGVGLGRYRYLSKLYTPPVEGSLARFGRWPNIAHSEYLQSAAEIGVPATLLMFGLIGYLLFLAWRRTESCAPDERIFHDAALYTAAGLGFHALVDNNFTVPVLAAGMAVISQADLLPYSSTGRKWQWTLPRRVAILLVVFAVYVHSTIIPAAAMRSSEAANRAYKQGDFSRAADYLNLALMLVPDDPALLDQVGTVYHDQFRKTERYEYLNEAESFFRKSLTANPDFERAGLHLEGALIQRLTGDNANDLRIHAQIVEADRHVLETNPFNPFIRKNLAEALYNSGDRQHALEELLKAIDIEPNYIPAYLRIAELLRERGQIEQSEHYRQRAMQIAVQYQKWPSGDTFESLLLGRPLQN